MYNLSAQNLYLWWSIDTCYEGVSPEERKRLLQYETQKKMGMTFGDHVYASEDWYVSKRNKPIRDEWWKIVSLEYNPYIWAQDGEFDHMILRQREKERDSYPSRCVHLCNIKDILLKQGYTMVQNEIWARSVPEREHIHFIRFKKLNVQEMIEFLQWLQDNGKRGWHIATERCYCFFACCYISLSDISSEAKHWLQAVWKRVYYLYCRR